MPHYTLNSLRGSWRSTAVAAWGSIFLEADGKHLCYSVVGNVLGKCQFVVESEYVKVLQGCAPGEGTEASSLPTAPCLAICISSIWLLLSIIIVVIQLLIRVQLFVTPWTAACQAPLSSTVSWSWLKFKFTELVMLSNHLIICCHNLVSKLLPRVLRAALVNYQTQSGGHGDLWPVSQHRWIILSYDWRLKCEGQSFGTELLTCGVWG